MTHLGKKRELKTKRPSWLLTADLFLNLFNKLDNNSFYRFGDTFYNHVFNVNKEMVVLVVVVVVQSLILTRAL